MLRNERCDGAPGRARAALDDVEGRGGVDRRRRPAASQAQHLLRVHKALKLADTRVGPSRQDTREDFDLQGAGGDHPFWISDDKTMFVFAAKDEDEQTGRGEPTRVPIKYVLPWPEDF